MVKKNGYKSGDIPQGNGDYLSGKKIPGKSLGMLTGGSASNVAKPRKASNDAMVGFGGGKKMSKVPGFGGKGFGGKIPQPKGYAKSTGSFTGSTKALKNVLLKG